MISLILRAIKPRVWKIFDKIGFNEETTKGKFLEAYKNLANKPKTANLAYHYFSNILATQLIRGNNKQTNFRDLIENGSGFTFLSLWDYFHLQH